MCTFCIVKWGRPPDVQVLGGSLFAGRTHPYNRALTPLENGQHMARKRMYRVVFHNQGKIYELYARSVSHGEMYGFVEIDEIVFGERSALLVDPSEERLKSEFAGVQRTFVPIHAVIRIDEVEKQGAAKIVAGDGTPASNVAPFPMPVYTPGGDQG